MHAETYLKSNIATLSRYLVFDATPDEMCIWSGEFSHLDCGIIHCLTSWRLSTHINMTNTLKPRIKAHVPISDISALTL